MNDGSSYVLFQIASQMWYQEVGLPLSFDFGTWQASLAYFVRMSLGGTLVGMAFGFGLLGILGELGRKLEKDFDVIQVVFGLATAYLCYFVCDQIITMSGIIATLACGIVVNRFWKRVDPRQGAHLVLFGLGRFLFVNKGLDSHHARYTGHHFQRN